MGEMSNNLKQNMTPKARLMIVLAVASVVGIVGFSVYRLSGGGAPPAESGGANLQGSPSSREISRDSPSDEVIFGSDTEIGQLYETSQNERSEAAIEKGDTHVDRFRLNDRDTKDVQRNDEIEKPRPAVTPVQNRLDALLAERTRLEDEQKTQVQARQVQQNQVRMQENPWKAFLDEEKNSLRSSIDTGRLSGASKDTAIPTPTVNVGSKNENKAAERQVPETSRPTSAQSDSDRIAQAVQRLTGRPVVAKQETADYPSERLSNTITDKEELKGKVLVGDTFMAVLQIGINTDEISEVKATIVEKGVLEGAVLVGTPSRVGEKAHIQFSNMGYKREGFGVSAVALDPDTYRSALADGVDRHTLSRWGGLGLAAFVEGYADAMTSSQTVNSAEGSSTTTRDGLPNSSDQAKYAIGNIGKRAAPIMEQQFNRPPTVTVEPNRIIYIMFTGEVELDSN